MVARISILILVVFALAATWLLLSPANFPTQRSLKAHEENWQLGQPATIDSDAALSVINQTGLWGRGPNAGAVQTVDEKPLTAPDWRIVGVYSEGDSNVALLAVDGQPQRQLRVGDTLPGGAKIFAITPDRICILLGGKKRSISSYRE